MIPKIIHQVWEGHEYPLPDFLRKLGDTWKEHHPDWRYEFWDGNRMKAFVENNYPEMATIYFGYKYNILRWDAIRYLILYKMGGMYVDFDYECLESFDNYLAEEKKCYFSMEAKEHRPEFGTGTYFNNALMVTPPGHSFFEYIIRHLETTPVKYTESKFLDVMYLTGPLMLTDLYDKFEDKSSIDFFPSEQVSPWSKEDVQKFINKSADEGNLEKKLEKAIAIHYFFGTWL